VRRNLKKGGGSRFEPGRSGPKRLGVPSLPDVSCNQNPESLLLRYPNTVAPFTTARQADRLLRKSVYRPVPDPSSLPLYPIQQREPHTAIFLFPIRKFLTMLPTKYHPNLCSWLHTNFSPPSSHGTCGVGAHRPVHLRWSPRPPLFVCHPGSRFTLSCFTRTAFPFDIMGRRHKWRSLLSAATLSVARVTSVAY
jgi:hypothetical protein